MSNKRSNPALNLAPFGRWTLRDEAAQHRLALRLADTLPPMTFDWPNLVVGGALGLLLTPLPGIVIAAVKRMTGVEPAFSTTGTWYSAEYDIRSADPDQKNTILKVALKRSLTGRITIRPSHAVTLANEKRPTSWLVDGEMHGSVLVGTWVSTEWH